MSTQAEPPRWLRDELRGGPPAWLRAQLRARGVGGHQASTAERTQAWARFTAKRDAAGARPAVYGRVFASMRDPRDISPLARRVFKAGR